MNHENSYFNEPSPCSQPDIKRIEDLDDDELRELMEECYSAGRYWHQEPEIAAAHDRARDELARRRRQNQPG